MDTQVVLQGPSSGATGKRPGCPESLPSSGYSGKDASKGHLLSLLQRDQCHSALWTSVLPSYLLSDDGDSENLSV